MMGCAASVAVGVDCACVIHVPSPTSAGVIRGGMDVRGIGENAGDVAVGVVDVTLGTCQGAGACCPGKLYCIWWAVSVIPRYHASICAVVVGPSVARKTSASTAPPCPPACPKPTTMRKTRTRLTPTSQRRFLVRRDGRRGRPGSGRKD